MNLIHRVEHWGDTHHPRWLDVLRIILGIAIFAKGVSFIADTDAVAKLVERTHFQLSTWSVVHYIAFAHLVGGILITLGLLTRVAVAFQLPILIGAVFFVNITSEFTFLNSEFWVSLIVLVLLIVFFIVGSGPYSMDHTMRKPGSKRWF
ncbi:DoxX family protein [Olivibacter sp. SDN3]|uniref:DoxX family protein n=1 Tax=Olivibacter sp. SDN3 TaxID=2764720 RepID=UPI001651282E|nr:DoxX family protein [Olivibacter sp. SDN3]QNL49630.1 DoxX family protein [Olivibacter sp. SDN3]